MAQRSHSLPCIVLHSRESTSGGRILSLLSPEGGIVDAFLFGGGKSRLRSLASPWHRGQAWLYRDRAEFSKLTDFDVLEDYPQIRSSLDALAGASLLSEVMLHTRALGGDAREAYGLAMHLLYALNEAAAGQPGGQDMDLAIMGFMAGVLVQMGLLPDPTACAHCSGIFQPNVLHFYSRQRLAFLCGRCAGPGGRLGETGLLALPAGALAWLGRQAAGQAAGRIGLAAESKQALWPCLVDILGRSVESPLKSLSMVTIHP